MVFLPEQNKSNRNNKRKQKQKGLTFLSGRRPIWPGLAPLVLFLLARRRDDRAVHWAWPPPPPPRQHRGSLLYLSRHTTSGEAPPLFPLAAGPYLLPPRVESQP